MVTAETIGIRVWNQEIERIRGLETTLGMAQILSTMDMAEDSTGMFLWNQLERFHPVIRCEITLGMVPPSTFMVMVNIARILPWNQEIERLHPVIRCEITLGMVPPPTFMVMVNTARILPWNQEIARNRLSTLAMAKITNQEIEQVLLSTTNTMLMTDPVQTLLWDQEIERLLQQRHKDTMFRECSIIELLCLVQGATLLQTEQKTAEKLSEIKFE